MNAEVMTLTGMQGQDVRLRPLLTGVAALLLILSAAGLASLLHGSAETIDRLRVTGDFRHVTPQAVRAAIEPQLGTGFVHLDLDALRGRIEALPWVEHARVERLWPGAVSVRVWERQPFARWGENALLGTDAVSFTPARDEIPAGLPLLSGPSGHEREVMEAYRQLGAALAATPFALAGLSMNARGEWLAQTRGGIELRLGRDAPDSKIAMITGPMTRALGQRLAEVQYVDLRYTNGFAVAWREPPAPVTREKAK